ncbi:MAG: hypothetical protein WCF57_05175 [Pyrinomonadaceae bacterium]
MTIPVESENLLDHLSARINARGWQVISNQARQPDAEAKELKILIQTMQKGRRKPGKRKIDDKDPPEAA